MDFLTDIGEPWSRPWFIHEYELTRDSLYAAVSGRYTQFEIITTLLKYSKNKYLPFGLEEYIKKFTGHYGKAKLVLKGNR